jgi:hypothetical protein
VSYFFLTGGNEIKFVQAKSSSTPDKAERRQATTEIPIIHGIPADFVEVSLPPPNSIAEVLEPIARVVYKEKTYRNYRSGEEVKNDCK